MTVLYMDEGSDIFRTDCEALVVGTNCLGVDGAGMAKAAARLYKGWSKEHKAVCSRTRPKPGTVTLFGEGRPHKDWPTQYLLALTTKDDWRNPSTLEWVRAGLLDLERTLYTTGIKAVAIPALGCGTHTGQLAWEDVRPLILATAERLSKLGVRVKVYPPAVELEAVDDLDAAVKRAKAAFKKADKDMDDLVAIHAERPTPANAAKLKPASDAKHAAHAMWAEAERAANAARSRQR